MSRYRPLDPCGPGSRDYLSLDEARECYRIVSERTGISVDDLLDERREKRFVKARWLVMREMRNRNASILMIARRMQMNHATVLYGLSRLKDAELGIAA